MEVEQETVVPGLEVARTLISQLYRRGVEKLNTYAFENTQTLPFSPPPRLLQKGDDLQFDQILATIRTIAEYCMPSIIKATFDWYYDQLSSLSSGSRSAAAKNVLERRVVGIELLVSRLLTEVLEQLPSHPGNLSLIWKCLESGFKWFDVHSSSSASTVRITTSKGVENVKFNDWAISQIRDSYAQMIGVIAQHRLTYVHARFVAEVGEILFVADSIPTSITSLLHGNAAHVANLENSSASSSSSGISSLAAVTATGRNSISGSPSPFINIAQLALSQQAGSVSWSSLLIPAAQCNSHALRTLLHSIKHFRVKMHPMEELEASMSFLKELGELFLESKDREVRHTLAQMFVEILTPMAAAVNNEVNVPAVKNFVLMLFQYSLDLGNRQKHRNAVFPLITCLLCVSQKQFFIDNWSSFLTLCLQQLKTRDPKTARISLESIYRLLWVYVVRVKCDSQASVTTSRLYAITTSLFPRGSKTIVPKDAPLNIFVKIIHFISQERLDTAMRDIVFDLMNIGRPVRNLAPERMTIGIRAFLVIAHSLQMQSEGEIVNHRQAGLDTGMPATASLMQTGSTLKVKFGSPIPTLVSPK